MKKITNKFYIAAIILIISIVMSISSCSTSASNTESKGFTCIYSCNYIDIIYMNDTKVMYAVGRNNLGAYTIELLVNADGTPRVYEE